MNRAVLAAHAVFAGLIPISATADEAVTATVHDVAVEAVTWDVIEPHAFGSGVDADGFAPASFRPIDPEGHLTPAMRDYRAIDGVEVAGPGTVQYEQDAASRRYRITGPGFRARFDRPKVLSLTPDGPALDKAPLVPGAIRPLVPDNAVFELTPIAEAPRRLELGEHAIDGRIDTRLDTRFRPLPVAPLHSEHLPSVTRGVDDGVTRMRFRDRTIAGMSWAEWLAASDPVAVPEAPETRDDADASRRPPSATDAPGTLDAE